MARIFKVTVFTKEDGEVGDYKVAAKDDVAARTRVVAQWVKEENEPYEDGDGKLVKPPVAKPTDVDYCEIEMVEGDVIM